MSKVVNIQKQIISASIELLESNPEGLRFSVLAKLLKEKLPDINHGNIPANLVSLQNNAKGMIYKPAKGWYRHEKYRDIEPQSAILTQEVQLKKPTEQQFYEPFAKWLVEELEDCSKAIPLGGSKFKDKWGTPDVLGLLMPKLTDIFTFPIEVVSAEIKVNTKGLITAFGQACSYQLFSHRVYIVIPKDSLPEDISRLDSLCSIFGLGLIIFDAYNTDDPDFRIMTRAITKRPDMFYVNKYLMPIADILLT